MRLVMTGLVRALALTLMLAGCNANRAPPVVELAPPATPAHVRVTSPELRTPQGGGCARDIARFRAIQQNDLAKGNVGKGVYSQIEADLAEADQACKAGDNLRAEGLLRATKARHGYPEG